MKYSGIKNTIVLTTMVAILSACGKSHSDNKSPATPSKPTVNATAMCENPIVLDEPGLVHLGEKQLLPQAKYKISEIQVFGIDEATRNTFLASAKESTQFNVNLDCNGVRNLTEDNYVREWTDADGRYHKKSSTHSEDISKTFRASETLDNISGIQALNQRVVKIEFKNGTLIEAKSYLEASSGSKNGSLNSVPLERISVGNDNFITLRVYAPTKDTMQIRIKFELAADENGKRSVQFAKISYVKTM